MKTYAPVVIYTYNRLEHLKKTITALQANHLASETDIFVASDGPGNEHVRETIKGLREYIDSIEGFRSVTRLYQKDNIGIVKSVQLAEQFILNSYDRLITMEDDIVTSPNFLDFINAGLDYYEDSDSVLTVGGYCYPIKIPEDYAFDAWNNPWNSPWGYGTWKRKYSNFPFTVNPWHEIKKNKEKYLFLKKYGDFFIENMIRDAQGLIVAGDARVCGQMLMRGLHTVLPTRSKVINIGLDGTGVHCPSTNKFDVTLDDGQQRVFSFSPDVLNMNEAVVKESLGFLSGNPARRLRRNIRRNLRKVDSIRTLLDILGY